MSKIQCTYCGNKVAKKSLYCTYRGNSIAKPKRKRKTIITLSSIVLVACGVLLFLFFFPRETEPEVVQAETEEIEEKEEKEERYKLFKHSDLNIADPLGLANEHNIIGKQIDEVLKGYEEGEDYYVEEDDGEYCYTFYKKIPYIVESVTASLNIYTAKNSSYIEDVEYSLRLNIKSDSYYEHMVLNDIKDSLTAFYDVDPEYFVFVDDEMFDITKDEYEELLADDFMAVYGIDWNSELGSATMFIGNIYEERDDDISVFLSGNTDDSDIQLIYM